jgi:hypothetical protein
MTGIFFYSILIFILLSVFVPSIYKYAYSCFIGRIVLVLLIIYFSKHNIILGLVFVAIIIITSMPLYEGFSPQDTLAKNYLVTSNTSIKDKTNNQQVFDYFTKYYCAKDSNGSVITSNLAPNKDKLKRWDDILNKKNPPADFDSVNLALSNKMLQEVICNSKMTEYYKNLSNNMIQDNSGDGCSKKFIDKNIYCGYWANIGECYTNPSYMLHTCERSCNTSDNSANNYVFNVPHCLPKNFKSEVCQADAIKKLISSATNVSDDPKLDPYLQQDGQWMLNMYSQLCPKT